MYLGIDVGFYGLKGIGNGQEINFPSCTGKATHPLLSLLKKDAIILEYGDQEYVIGAEAVRTDEGARKETSEWIKSQEYLRLFHGALSEITGATQASMSIVTGLPIADITHDKEILKGRLMGVHIFTRKDKHKQRITVDSVRVVPQGWGAVLSLLFDERGNVAQDVLATQKIGVLDIGGHNVQYLSVDGLNDMPKESRSTERGAWNVMRAVREFLDTEHRGLSRLSDYQIMDAIISKQELYDGNKRVDLEPVLKPILSDIGQEIIDTAGQYWGLGASTFRSILVCGGGAYLWGKDIAKAFSQAVVLDRPEFSNAQGYHNFAVYLDQKDRTYG